MEVLYYPYLHFIKQLVACTLPYLPLWVLNYLVSVTRDVRHVLKAPLLNIAMMQNDLHVI